MRRILNPPTPTHAHQIIPVPLEPILETWVKRYRLIEKKLDKAKREWQLFEENANPHYQKWYYSTFAEDLSKLTDWNERARSEESILRGIVAHQRIYHLDEFQAYARVKERLRLKLGPYPDQADIDRYEKEQLAREEAERKRREAAREKRKKAEAEKFWESEADAEAYAEELRRAFAEFIENESTSGNRFHSDPDEPVSSEAHAQHKRQDDLRGLYRSIVRRLHPDTGHEMTSVEKDWWHQAQTAYRNSDIETLKLIALRIQGQGEVEIDKIKHVGTLIELCAALFDQQDQIDRQRKHLKRDPVYRFWMSRTKANPRDKLTFELRAQLESQLRRLKGFVAEVKSRLHELERMSSGAEDPDEEFDPRARRRASLPHGKAQGRGRGRGRGR